jgi:hypothetical protein
MIAQAADGAPILIKLESPTQACLALQFASGFRPHRALCRLLRVALSATP